MPELKTRAPRKQGPSDVSLVTGFPAFTARRLVHRLLERDRRELIYLLTEMVAA